MSTIDDLKAIANREHAAVELATHDMRRAARSGVEHAIIAGEALREIHAQLPYGSWGKWLVENFAGSEWLARTYIRFAHRQDQIRAAENLSFDAAVMLCRQLV